jgi:hypothetical protein
VQRRVGILVILALSVGACGGSGGSASSGTSAGTRPTTTSTSEHPGTFGIDANEYAQRFNAFAVPVLNAKAEDTSPFVATPIRDGLLGGHTSSDHGVYLATSSDTGKVAAVVVTTPSNAGNVNVPTLLLQDACAVALDPTQTAASARAFPATHPSFDNIDAAKVVKVKDLYDIRFVTTPETVGFVCVPPGAAIPGVVLPLPS